MGEFYIKQHDELYHYGVKGMKWGVRKQRELIGRRVGPSGGDYQRQQRRRSAIKKVAIGTAAIAAVAGVSYVALTKTDSGQLATKLGRDAIRRTLNVTKNTVKTNRTNPGKDKANYLPKDMRSSERLSRKRAKRFAKEHASEVYKSELDRARRRNYMYTYDGKANFTKKTMRELEARSKNVAKNISSDVYLDDYKKELERARRMNYMYHY